MSTRNQNLSLRGLRTFCVAAQHASFRDAADRLFITASAVSHQVKNLEDEIGVKLFERLPRSIELTDAGKALYDELRPLIQALDAVATRHRRTAFRSNLRISVQPFLASEIFVPSLSEFTQLHPEIDLTVDTSDESAQRHPATADVSIRVFASPPERFASDRLFALRLVPAASPAFLARLKRNGMLASGMFPRIVHESRPDAWNDWQTVSGIALAKSTNLIRLDSMIAVARAAERGLGAALVPIQLSDSWFDSGSLVKLFPHELETKDAYYFVCRHEDKGNENVQRLRQWVLQNFGDRA